MLPSVNRLPGSKLPQVLRSQNLIHSPLFTLKLASKSNSTSSTQIGFIVSKKIARHAIDRNKIKRLFRQAVKLNLKNLKKGYYLLFLAKTSLKDQSLEIINQQVVASLKQANLFHDS